MLTEHEKEQLVHDYQREPASVAGLLLTCAGGLLMVWVLALAGLDIIGFSNAPTTTQAANTAR